jgi:hypothetical protein
MGQGRPWGNDMGFKVNDRAKLTTDKYKLDKVNLPRKCAGKTVTIFSVSANGLSATFCLDGWTWWTLSELLTPVERQMYFQFPEKGISNGKRIRSKTRTRSTV